MWDGPTRAPRSTSTIIMYLVIRRAGKQAMLLSLTTNWTWHFDKLELSDDKLQRYREEN